MSTLLSSQLSTGSLLSHDSGVPSSSGETLTSLTAKSVAILVVFLSAWFGALLPYGIKKFNCAMCSESRQSTILSLINCLSGGFFISASLFHILPNSLASFKQLSTLLDGNGIAKYSAFPFMIASLGFMFPLVIHNLLNALVARVKSSSSEEDESMEEPLNSSGEKMESEDKTKQSLNRVASYVLSTVLSTQSVLIGITSGVIVDTADAFVLIVTMILHKWVAAFSISVQSMRSGMTFWGRVMPIMLIFSTMTPMGIFIGILLVRYVTNKIAFLVVGIIFKSLGAGFFIYVSTLMILRTELVIAKDGSGAAGCHSNHKQASHGVTKAQRNIFLLKILFVVLGYLVMTIPYSMIGKMIASDK